MNYKTFFRKKFRYSFILLLTAVFAAFCLCACNGGSSGEEHHSSSDTSNQTRKTLQKCLEPKASGKVTKKNGNVQLDLSNTEDGYIMVLDQGSAQVQIQITNPNGDVYPYPLTLGRFMAFPLTEGSGKYRIQVLEQVSGNNYAVALSMDFKVNLKDEFHPFLYPNQYVNYTNKSEAVRLGRKLSKKSRSDLDYVENVYDYIINGIAYDNQLAKHTPTNYIPDVDKTLKKKKGICFDYAALMTAMLRSQGIPTRLEVGYSDDVYHAWISVYLDETGWVDNIISFDGKDWTLIDPTLGANNDSEDVKEYVGDDSNYTTKYTY